MSSVGFSRRRVLVSLGACGFALLAAACGGSPATSVPAATATGGSDATAATETPSVAAGSLVTYTDSGFSPSSITVKLGDSVTFRNESSGNFWVASSPHPVHTDLPGFDAKKPIAPGGEYVYTFEQAGEWGYHSHLKPSHGGTVIVQ